MEEYSKYTSLHRKILNTVKFFNKLTPTMYSYLSKLHPHSYILIFQDLCSNDCLKLDGKNYVLTMKGYIVRDILNEKRNEVLVPIVISSIATLISAISVIMQVV